MAGTWVDMNAGKQPPSNGLIGGRDVDGSPIFVGRAHHNGELIPAKVLKNSFRAFIPYGGEEILKKDFQILCGGKYDWVSDSDGHVPDNAFIAGHDGDNKPLYVGKVFHLGSETIGKVQPSNRVCFIPFNREELSFHHYKVLVKLN